MTGTSVTTQVGGGLSSATVPLVGVASAGGTAVAEFAGGPPGHNPALWRAEPLLTRRKAALFSAVCAGALAVAGLVGGLSGGVPEIYKQPIVQVAIDLPRASPAPVGAGDVDVAAAPAGLGWTLPDSAPRRDNSATPAEPVERPTERPTEEQRVEDHRVRPGDTNPFLEANLEILGFFDGTLAKFLALLMVVTGLMNGMVRQEVFPLLVGVGGGLMLMNAGRVVRALLGIP